MIVASKAMGVGDRQALAALAGTAQMARERDADGTDWVWHTLLLALGRPLGRYANNFGAGACR